MENKEIFELIERFENSGLSELEIEEESRKIRMKKDCGAAPVIHYAGFPAAAPAAVAPAAGIEGAPVKAAPAAERKPDNDAEYIRSPIVGVYYKAPSPDEPDFVSVGDRVSKGQTLCVIEAMKVMNELKAPYDGIVKAIYGLNGELVEYDEILFEVKKC